MQTYPWKTCLSAIFGLFKLIEQMRWSKINDISTLASAKWNHSVPGRFQDQKYVEQCFWASKLFEIAEVNSPAKLVYTVVAFSIGQNWFVIYFATPDMFNCLRQAENTRQASFPWIFLHVLLHFQECTKQQTILDIILIF